MNYTHTNIITLCQFRTWEQHISDFESFDLASTAPVDERSFTTASSYRFYILEEEEEGEDDGLQC